MKALQINTYTSYKSLTLSETPVPKPGENQLLVKIKAASLNPFDLKLLSGIYRNSIPLKLPYVMGGDFAGIVESKPDGIKGYKTGDEVFGSATVLSGGTGSFAGYASVKADTIAIKPKISTFEEAASLPLVGSSAVQALLDIIKLKKGQKILIHGGAGGIGSLAIQIAKHTGAYVASTVSAEDMSFARFLGADLVIDYNIRKFEDKISGYDAVFDTVGRDVTDRSLNVIRKGGTLVSMVNIPDKTAAAKLNINAIRQSTKTNSEHLSRITAMVENKILQPQIDRIFSFSDFKSAFAYQETQSPKGKVVIKIS